MDFNNVNDAVTRRIKAMNDRLEMLKANEEEFKPHSFKDLISDFSGFRAILPEGQNGKTKRFAGIEAILGKELVLKIDSDAKKLSSIEGSAVEIEVRKIFSAITKDFTIFATRASSISHQITFFINLSIKSVKL